MSERGFSNMQPTVENDGQTGKTTTTWSALLNFTDRAHFFILLPALFLSALSGILLPAVAIFMGQYFDALANYGAGELSDDELVHKVLFSTYGLVLVGAATWLLKGGYFTLWLVFGETQAKSVRDKLFQSLLLKDLEWFEMRSSGVGSLLSRLQTQIRELQIGTSQPLGFCVENIVQAIASLGVCFYYSWKVTLVTLAGIPFSAICISILASTMQSSIRAQEIEMAKASSIATNAFSCIDTVKCFNGQDYEARQYGLAVQKAAKFYLKQALNTGLQMGFVRFILTSMFVQGFWYGSSLVRNGDASTGTVITTFWSALMATRAWEDALPHLNVLQKGRAAAVALKAILQRVENGRKATTVSSGISPKFCEGDIEVRRVSFAYPSRPEHAILHESTFFFPAGETTFIVGRSGSGKSTVGNLLMRFYPLTTGQILLDGTEIRELDTSWLRNNITLVQQGSILFNETIMRNIAFGQQDFRSVTIEQVRVCIELAALHDTIREMPKGLETMVGTRGSALSGGQKQRVALARARLRDTPILILDESTSALDYVSRTSVMNAIREWRRGKTTVVITHDMGQIQSDDFVYVLDDGYIIEEGYRHSLAGSDKKGLFSTILRPPPPPLAPQLDFRTGSVRRLSRRGGFNSGKGTIAERRPSPEEPDSIDLQLDSIAGDLTYRPQSVSYSFPNAVKRPLTRPASPIKAVARAIRPESRTERTSLLLHHPRLEQDLAISRKPSVRTGNDASRPMSMHQSMVMRSIYRHSSVGSRSDSSSIALEKRQAHQGRILAESPPARNKHEQASMKNILDTLWPSLDFKHRILLFLGLVAVLVRAAGVPAFAYIFSQLLGTFFIKEHQAQKALFYSTLILAVAIIDGNACLVSWYFLEAVGEFWVDNLRLAAMTRVLDQPKVWFNAGSNTVSHITSSLDRNGEEVRNLVGRFIGLITTACTMMLIAIIWALLTCWKVTLVGLAAAPLMYSVARSYETVSSRWEGRTNEASDATEAIFVEAFGDILTVRALTLESYFHRKYTAATSDALTTGVRRAIYCGFFFGASDSTIHFVTALIFWYGGHVVQSHQFSVKSVLVVFTMLLSSTSNATAAIAFVPQIASSIDSGSRLLRLARLPWQASHEYAGKLKLDPQTPKTAFGQIEFANLTFYYPSRPEAPALSNLNLTIPSGRCTAIVGSSGSGKSTIASLLLGLYPPSTSERPGQLPGSPPITICGHDIRSLHLPTLRSIISIVPQTPTLFPTSVRANITYGLELNSALSSLANMEHAAQRAGIHDFIVSLPQGYETLVGDGGLGLSGGQAQRIVIARALCRRPKLLILDEATSALDGESAGIVRKSVMDLVREGSGMTVIIITHARDMMQCADKIVVLEQGKVAEEGGLGELLARKGRLWGLLRAAGLLDER